MEQATCPGVVQTAPDFTPICTDGAGGFYAWEGTPPFFVNLSSADIAALLSATLFTFAVVFSVRIIYRVIVNR